MFALNRRDFLSTLATVPLFQPSHELPGFPSRTQPDPLASAGSCCAMLLEWFGLAQTISACQARTGNPRRLSAGGFGVDLVLPASVESCLDALGLRSSLARGSLDDVTRAIAQDRPAILLVRASSDAWRYVVAIGYSGRGARIKLADPIGQVYWMDGTTLDAAWAFSHDLQGNPQGGQVCRGCAGTGRNPTPQGNCPTCAGTGRIPPRRGFSIVQVGCPTCGGSGRVQVDPVCAFCKGTGREPDYPRQAVELVHVSGRTLITPRKSRPAQLAREILRNLPTDLPSDSPDRPQIDPRMSSSRESRKRSSEREKSSEIDYSIENETNQTVHFRVEPEGSRHTLEAGRTYRGSSRLRSGQKATITLDEPERTYRLSEGRHRFVWSRREKRIVFAAD